MHLLVKNIKCWIPNHVQKPGNTYTAVSLMIISSIFGSPTWCSYAPIHGLDLVIMTKAWNLDIYILQMMVFGIVARKYELSWLIGSIKAEQFRVGQARCKYNEWWCIYKKYRKINAGGWWNMHDQMEISMRYRHFWLNTIEATLVITKAVCWMRTLHAFHICCCSRYLHLTQTKYNRSL